MERIEVRPMGPGEYADEDERARLVEESVAFLLDREPGDAVPHDVDLDELAGEFADYVPELRARLAR